MVIRAAIFLPVVVLAYPSFRYKVPNGLRVEWEGETCHGLGHNTCVGGSLPLNPFGEHFKKEGHLWTKALCEMDSDDDGISNGAELGDPCCLWQADDEPSDYTRNFKPTHPGNKDSSDAATAAPTNCELSAPKAKAEQMGEFNPGEEQRVAEFRIKNYTIPAEKTTYVDIAFNFDDASADIFHVVRAETMIHQKAHLHHYIIQACDTHWPEDLTGIDLAGTDKSRFPTCTSSFGGWAPGQLIISNPSWAGSPVGKGAGKIGFKVQIHYDNQAEKAGVVTQDGFRIFYTPTLRNITLSDLKIMQVSVQAKMVIPKNQSRYFYSRECTVKLSARESNAGKTNADFRGIGDGVRMVTSGFHAHLLGREMYMTIKRAGMTDADAEEDLASQEIWHFDDQGNKNMLPQNIAVYDGDRIQATCVFDSTSRDKNTVMGMETTDEMCWASFQYASKYKAECSGDIWGGSLAKGEDARLIPKTKPKDLSDSIFGGTKGLEPIKFMKNEDEDPFMTVTASDACPAFLAERCSRASKCFSSECCVEGGSQRVCGGLSTVCDNPQLSMCNPCYGNSPCASLDSGAPDSSDKDKAEATPKEKVDTITDEPTPELATSSAPEEPTSEPATSSASANQLGRLFVMYLAYLLGHHL